MIKHNIFASHAAFVHIITTSSPCRMSTLLRPVAAVCQVTATPDKKANFSACKQLVEEAKGRGASMVFLPEAFDYIGSSREETLSLSESLTGDTISQYSQLARYTHCFVIIDIGPMFCCCLGQKSFFSQIFFNKLLAESRIHYSYTCI